MALLTDIADKATGSVVSAADFNNLKNAVMNAIGVVSAGVGTLDYTNLAVAAALRAAQTQYTAATLTNTAAQSVVGPTAFTEFRDTIAGNMGTLANASAGSVTLVNNKQWQKTGGTNTITTIVPGSNHVEGSVIYLVCIHSLTLTNTTTDTLNSVHRKQTSLGIGTPVGAATQPSVFTLVYSKMDGLFTNLQWTEL